MSLKAAPMAPDELKKFEATVAALDEILNEQDDKAFLLIVFPKTGGRCVIAGNAAVRPRLRGVLTDLLEQINEEDLTGALAITQGNA